MIRFYRYLSIVISVLVAFGGAFLPTNASATRYECFIKDSASWHGGENLKYSSTVKKQKKPTLIYDDERGVLQSGSGLLGSGGYEILQKLHNDNALVAIRQVVSGDYAGSETLYIRHGKRDRGNLFFLYLSGDGAISGKCHEQLD